MRSLTPPENCPHCGQKWLERRRQRRRSFILLLIRYAGELRRTTPLWYVFLVPTVFHKWYNANPFLAGTLWFGMLALVALSWMVTLTKRIRG